MFSVLYLSNKYQAQSSSHKCEWKISTLFQQEICQAHAAYFTLA